MTAFFPALLGEAGFISSERYLSLCFPINSIKSRHPRVNPGSHEYEIVLKNVDFHVLGDLKCLHLMTNLKQSFFNALCDFLGVSCG